MVGCISKGRMGNFGFANMAAFCYSLKHGLDFHIQDTTLAPHMWPLYFQHLVNSNWNPNLPTVYVNDDSHRYRELPFEESWRDKNIIIGTPDIQTGYFQSYKYLEGYEDQIRDTFFPEVAWADGLYSYTRCAVHLRRQDYVELKTRHPPITIEYLEQAITYMALKGINNFDFYSDDMDWVKANVHQLPRDLHYHFIEGGMPEQDFISIMTTPNVITANSSFSVLAAILNPWPAKKIACPDISNYMGPENSHLSVVDLYPPEWHQIKY